MIWSSVLGLFQAFLNHEFLFPVLIEMRESSQKILKPLCCEGNLIESNPSNNAGATNFQLYEVFLAHLVIKMPRSNSMLFVALYCSH